MLPSLHYLTPNAAKVNPSFNSNSKRQLKYISILFLPFVAILVQAPFVASWGQITTISIDKLTPASTCFNADAETPVRVAYTADAPAIPGTIFTAQLSDANGEFGDNPTNIGDTTSQSGTPNINATIPAGTLIGSGYIIRVISSNDPLASSLSADFSIDGPADAGLDQTGCSSVPTTDLVGSSPGSGTGLWDFIPGGTGDGNGNIAQPTNPASPFTGTIGVQYTLRWTVTNACNLGETGNFDQVNVTFSGLTTDLSLALSTKDASQCSLGGGAVGATGIIVGTATGGTGAGTYHFSLTPPPASNNDDSHSPTVYTARNLPPGSYSMRVTDANGCTDLENTSIMSVPAPAIAVSTLGNVSACSTTGDDGFFTLRVFPRTSINATAVRPYSFQLGTPDTAGVDYNNNQPIVRFGPLAVGTYVVTMHDGVGCQSNTLTVPIGTDAPLALEVLDQIDPSSCSASDGIIKVKQPTGGSRHSQMYSLSSDGGNSFGPEQNSRIFAGLGAGNYIIMVRDSRSCTAQTGEVPLVCTGFRSMAGSTDDLNLTAKNALSLQVLPNPTSTTFTLNLQSNSKENVQVIVTDMLGKKLYEATGGSNQRYTFGQEFNSGMYIVRVIQGTQIQTLKLVKEN